MQTRPAPLTPWRDGSASPGALSADLDLPQSVGYRVKRGLLGPPLTRDDLKHERLSKRLALGVLSSDCISSSAYGTEEMLIVLIPAFGIAAFTILLPLTAVVLAVLLIVTLSYRDVVSIYTKTGGSYVVARENFGPVVAQVAAVALMLDYIVTVAVQTAAGTAALVSAVPSLTGPVPGPWPGTWLLTISVLVVALLFYGNLRGVREAGKTFAFPTYFFVVSLLVVILIGVVRETPRRPASCRRPGAPVADGSRRGDPRVRSGLHLLACLRERRFLADRAGGRLQRGQRVQAPRGAKRAQDLGHHERHPRHVGTRRVLAGARDARGAPAARHPDGDLPGHPGDPGQLRDRSSGLPRRSRPPRCSSSGPEPTHRSAASRSSRASSPRTGSCPDS